MSSNALHMRRRTFPLALLLVVAMLCAAWGESNDGGQGARFVPPAATALPADSDSAPEFETRVVATYDSGVAHSPSLIAYPDGSLQAIWFAGSREGAPDVRLDTSRFVDGSWGPASPLLDAESEQRERGVFVRAIGNPVLFAGATGETWLAYVTTVLGGWATSRISIRRSLDQGRSWEGAKFLRLSPLFGISNLVRFPALPMEGARFGLPVYHELIRNFGEIAVLDGAGEVVGKHRIGAGGDLGIQPALLFGGEGQIEALLRPSPGMEPRTYRSVSDDGGLH